MFYTEKKLSLNLLHIRGYTNWKPVQNTLDIELFHVFNFHFLALSTARINVIFRGWWYLSDNK